jgi:hypothetical protein
VGGGAVNGPPVKYGGFVLSSGKYVSGDAYSSTWEYKILGLYSGTSSLGLLGGTRLGPSWASLGDDKLTEAGSADYHLTMYGGPFALGLGYTTDKGEREDSLGNKDQVGYGGFFAEPAIGVALGPVYLASMVALIGGTTSIQRGGTSNTQEESAFGRHCSLLTTGWRQRC